MTTRRDLVDRIAATTGYPKTHVSKVLRELFDELTDALVDEGRFADTAKEKQCPHGEQQDARKSCGGPRTVEAASQARDCCFAADKDFQEETAFVGLAATNPTLLS